MTKDDFIKLYERDLSGHCTPEEKQLLELYRDDFHLEEKPWNEARMGIKEQVGKAVYEGLLDAIEKNSKSGAVPVRTNTVPDEDLNIGRWGIDRSIWMGRNRQVWIPAAAIIFLVVLGGVFFNIGKKTPDQVAVKETGKNGLIKDVLPGSNKAVLILADGARILLDSADNGELAQQGNTKVLKLGNGQLAYHGEVPNGNLNIKYNTISTPRGGQYQIILPDGSKAWLNAASSLRFPTAFAGRERRVELMGEGYFEVVKNQSMPFRVTVTGAGLPEGNEHGSDGRTVVEVLGTFFNVMAYSDENTIKTTLLEGSVKIRKGAAGRVLKPGQQAQLKQDGRFVLIEGPNIEEAVAWKDDLFLFDNTDVQSAMRQIARWYDVDVRYEGNSTGGFNGQISKKATISELLKMLELTGEAHFKIDGRQVTVLP